MVEFLFHVNLTRTVFFLTFLNYSKHVCIEYVCQQKKYATIAADKSPPTTTTINTTPTTTSATPSATSATARSVSVTATRYW